MTSWKESITICYQEQSQDKMKDFLFPWNCIFFLTSITDVYSANSNWNSLTLPWLWRNLFSLTLQWTKATMWRVSIAVLFTWSTWDEVNSTSGWQCCLVKLLGRPYWWVGSVTGSVTFRWLSEPRRRLRGHLLQQKFSYFWKVWPTIHSASNNTIFHDVLTS